MNKNQQSFTQLLQTHDLENWQLAWQIAQGLPELRNEFMDAFFEVMKNYEQSDLIAYELATEYPELQAALLKEMQEYLMMGEWQSDLVPHLETYEVISFFPDNTGILFMYGPQDYDGLEDVAEFTGYEKFEFKLFFDEKDIFPYIQMKFLEGKAYYIDQDKPSPLAEAPSCQGTFPIEMHYNAFRANHLVLRIQSFYYAEEIVFEELNGKQTIPDFDEWKKELLEG